MSMMRSRPGVETGGLGVDHDEPGAGAGHGARIAEPAGLSGGRPARAGDLQEAELPMAPAAMVAMRPSSSAWPSPASPPSVSVRATSPSPQRRRRHDDVGGARLGRLVAGPQPGGAGALAAVAGDAGDRAERPRRDVGGGLQHAARRGLVVQRPVAGGDGLDRVAQGERVLVAARELREHGGVVDRHGRLRRDGVGEPHLLAAELALALVVEDLDEADALALMHHRQDEQALVAVAAHDGDLGRVGVRVAHVDGDALVVLDRPPRHGELAQRVLHRVRLAVAAVVVLGAHGDRAGGGLVVRDDAQVRVHQGGHLLGDLAQQRGGVELAGDGDGGGDQGLELALAGQPRGEVVAAADEVRQLVDVLLLDAPVAPGGARAGEEARRRPAADGVGRDAEAPRRELHAQIHAQTVASPSEAVNRANFRDRGSRSSPAPHDERKLPANRRDMRPVDVLTRT